MGNADVHGLATVATGLLSHTISMPKSHPLEAHLAAAWPPDAWQDVTVLLAVSGGADSVALLRAMAALKTAGEGVLCAAHLNHQLRGRESDDDEAFVVELCRKLDIRCEVGRTAVLSEAHEDADGLEAAARRVRYEFLEQTAARLGARYVAAAHTADDQAETILHRIVRGTGIGGLAGMPRVRALNHATTLIRPLLGMHRSDLVSYLNELKQPYRSDSSNDDTRFTRNRIRHELLPQLANEYNSGVVDAVLRLGSLADEVQCVVDSLVDDLWEQSVAIESPDNVRIRTADLTAQPRYLIRELLIAVWRRQGWPMQAMGFAQWDLLAEMVAPEEPRSELLPTKQTLPGNVLAEIGGEELRLLYQK